VEQSAPGGRPLRADFRCNRSWPFVSQHYLLKEMKMHLRKLDFVRTSALAAFLLAGVPAATHAGAPAAGTLHFFIGAVSVAETDGHSTLAVQRSGGTTGAVTVAYATADGSATAGEDYAETEGILSWADGEGGVKSITVPITDDSVLEPSETFSATLSNPTGGATLGSPTAETVTIADDDNPCLPCTGDDTTLCLAGGSGDPTRFRVRVTWENFEHVTGPGKAVPNTPDSGFFYFFNPNNLELLVKMVNACSTELESFWFYYAAASNVGLEYEVVDTHTCVTRTYTNVLGNFASFGDIHAFACPGS
jgi:hypothetical protein